MEAAAIIQALTGQLEELEKYRLRVLDQYEHCQAPEIRGLLGEMHQLYDGCNEAVRLVRNTAAGLVEAQAALAAQNTGLQQRLDTMATDWERVVRELRSELAELRAAQPLPPQDGPIAAAAADLAPPRPNKHRKRPGSPAPTITPPAAESSPAPNHTEAA